MFFVGERPKGGELPEDNSSSAGASASSEVMGSFPLLRGTGCRFDCYLAHLFHQDLVFFLPEPATDRSHAAGVQHDPVTPSSALLALPISFPCLDANGGTDLLAIGSSD